MHNILDCMTVTADQQITRAVTSHRGKDNDESENDRPKFHGFSLAQVSIPDGQTEY